MNHYETVNMTDLGKFENAEKIVAQIKRQGIDAVEAADHILVPPAEEGRARQFIAEAQVAIWAKDDRNQMLMALLIAAVVAAMTYIVSRLINGSPDLVGGSFFAGAIVGYLNFPRKSARLGMILGGVEGLGAALLLKALW